MGLFVLHGGEPDITLLLDKIPFQSGVCVPKDWKDPVFRWGTYADDPSEENRKLIVLNPLRSVIRTAHPHSRIETLRLNGIRSFDLDSNEIESSFAHLFIVAVFHLSALSLHASKHNGYLLLNGRDTRDHFQKLEEVTLPAKTFHAQRAIRQAIRSVYALGLDFAVVTIGVTPKGSTEVISVEPNPKLDHHLATKLSEQLIEYEREWKQESQRKSDVVLGADPEFVLQAPNGRIVPASQFFDPEGVVGSDAIMSRNGVQLRPLAELRPAPSTDPRQLTENLHQAMLQADKRINVSNIAWLAGGRPLPGLPLGGHIHFSGMWLSSFFLRILDNYMALPLSLLESGQSRMRRPRYGALGDFRRKQHGGFEYRTPVSWIGTPERALGVLSLAKVLANHYKQLDQFPLRHIDYLRQFYRGQPKIDIQLVKILWSQLENTPTYKQFREPLEQLKQDCMSQNQWNDQQDIRPFWFQHNMPVYRKERTSPKFMV